MESILEKGLVVFLVLAGVVFVFDILYIVIKGTVEKVYRKSCCGSNSFYRCFFL